MDVDNETTPIPSLKDKWYILDADKGIVLENGLEEIWSFDVDVYGCFDGVQDVVSSRDKVFHNKLYCEDDIIENCVDKNKMKDIFCLDVPISEKIELLEILAEWN